MGNFVHALESLNVLKAEASFLMNNIRWLVSFPITNWQVTDLTVNSGVMVITVQAYNLTIAKHVRVLNNLLS